MRTGLLLFLSFLACISAEPALAEKRVALVIGVSRYQQVPQLTNPARDADAIASLFRKAGFDVVNDQRDLGLADLRRVIREFSEVSRDADISVIYYAGHGIEIDGTNYLVPADAQLSNDFDVEDETVSLDRVLRALDPVRRLRLVILDACRENPFSKAMKRSVATRSVGRGLAKIEPTTSNTLVAFAAKAGALADDGGGENSPFAAALLKYIAVPGLDLRIAFGRVRDEVLKRTGNRQEPFVYGSLGGETLALVPQIEKPVDPETEARFDYELAARVGTREAWDSFLVTHPSGFYANLARAQNSKLQATQQSPARDDEAQPQPGPARQEAPEEVQAAGAQVQAEQAKRPGEEGAGKIAALTTSEGDSKTSPPSSPQLEQADIARLLQMHLKRVGCGSGNVDGNWNDSSSRALELFNKNAKTRFDSRLASLEALDAVRSEPDRVCPLICAKGARADGDRCVQTGCGSGFFRSSSGSCRKQHEPARRPRTAMRTPGLSAGSGSSSPCELDASGHRRANIRSCW